MDYILQLADDLILDNVWAKFVYFSSPAAISSLPGNTTSIEDASTCMFIQSTIPHASEFSPHLCNWLARDYLPRQIVSILALTLPGITAIYFIFSTLSYYYLFNHELMKHPRFLKNQVRLEIAYSLRIFPWLTLYGLPWFVGEVRGSSKLYTNVSDYGWTYLVLSIFVFMFFTDVAIYIAHRLLHHPLFYKRFHKLHHRWHIPTPFASYAFHPVEAFVQSLPYHSFAFIFPMQRYLYLGMFAFIYVWTVVIHDSDMTTGHSLEAIINGPSHHTLHHLYFNCNYGQYLSLADRLGNSYRMPRPELDPLLEVKAVERAEGVNKLE
ncbi:hypothetical protein BOTBODRAFT_128591 [Botryobasidium botryosum FD-172 SS1]|uniref:Fatty acid hydroxylase domain-containing protein n=1 Tax=Botryobasidium botryosum (strain FD-172 SS1) TaxID=930990 RepID=A0A067MPT8_BOTB1|nr:hypothetical protein BOTBODRAFT_128591 [Botryobasidium botryosum FD-172 SS1]